jgi:polyisoprenoid-binding protein YceI
MKAAIISVTATVLSLGTWTAVTSSAPAPATAVDEYQVDPVHSSMVFRIKHAGAANFYGRFNSIAGNFALDDDAGKCSFRIQIPAESVDTGNPQRDQHVKSPDFLSAKEFPTISFQSKQVKKSGSDSFDVTGDLTMHGETKSVTAKVTKTGTGKNFGKTVVGVEAVLTIKRTEFGVGKKFGPEVLGDEIQITVSMEASKK